MDLTNAVKNTNNLTEEEKASILEYANVKYSAETHFQSTCSDLINRIRNLLSQNKSYDLPVVNINNALDDEFLKQYVEQIYRLLQVSELISESMSYIRATTCALIGQNKLDSNIPKLSELNYYHNMLNESLEKNKQQMRINTTVGKARIKNVRIETLDQNMIIY